MSNNFGLLFIPVGFAFLWFTTEQGHLICEREPGQPATCQLERSNIYGHRSSDTFTTDQIQSVRAHSYPSKLGDNHYAQICLNGRNLLISDEHQGSRESVYSAVAQLNEFKDSPEEERIELVLGSDFLWKWGVLMFSVAGVAMLFHKEGLGTH